MEYFEQNALRPHRRIFSQVGMSCFAILFIASVLQLAAHYLILNYALV
jgi:hypothetical protein